MPNVSKTWISRTSATERRDLIWIGKIRQLDCFSAICRKLAAGESPLSVAKWVVELKVDGECGQWKLSSWQKRIQAIARIVHKRLVREPNPAVVALEVQAVMEEVERQREDTVGAALADEVVPEEVRPIWREIKQAFKDIDAETALKYCWIIQQGRMQQI